VKKHPGFSKEQEKMQKQCWPFFADGLPGALCFQQTGKTNGLLINPHNKENVSIFFFTDKL